MPAISAPIITKNAPTPCRQGAGSPDATPTSPATLFSRFLNPSRSPHVHQPQQHVPSNGVGLGVEFGPTVLGALGIAMASGILRRRKTPVQVTDGSGKRTSPSLLRFAGLIAVLSVVGVTAQAAVIQYDGSTLPVAAGPAPWRTLNLPGPYNLHGVQFANTAWSSTDGVFTMTTYPVRGIWLGNFQSYQGTVNTNWDVSTSAMGNDYSARMRLPTGAREWSFYINDRAYGASFYLDFDLLRFRTPAGQQTVPFDGTQFHTYGILLKEGLVEYTLDGNVLYAGPAYASVGDWGFLIGDDSGGTPTGAGSMEIDWINMDTAPTRNVEVVPEPATLVLLGIAPLAMLRRRRKTATPTGRISDGDVLDVNGR